MALKQHGGEGTEFYKKTSSDSNLKQHGGEGKNVGKKSDMKLSGQGSELGPGRNLKVTAN